MVVVLTVAAFDSTQKEFMLQLTYRNLRLQAMYYLLKKYLHNVTFQEAMTYRHYPDLFTMSRYSRGLTEKSQC